MDQRDDGDEFGREQRTARSGMGFGGTAWSWDGCVRKLAVRGVKRAHWGFNRSTGARRSTAMAATELGSHGVSMQRVKGEGAVGAFEA